MFGLSFKQLVTTIFLAVSCFLFVPNQELSAQTTIAHVDMEQIIENMPDYKSVKSQLEAFQKTLEKQLQAEEKKLQDYYASVMQQAQAGTMSPQQQKDAEAKLTKMQEDLQKKAADAEKQLIDKEASLSKPVFDKLNNALKSVASKNKYAYIVDKKLLLYSDGGIDATAKLKAELGM